MDVILILSFVSYALAFDKASFYGASYISYPLQEAKGVTDISFRFRTHLSDALLLLAAGKTDYCMIRLEKGKLKLNINLGAGESELSSPKGSLNDSQWHHVSIIRREANLTLKIDDSAVKKRLPGRFFELNIHFGVFLGGQGHFSELFLGHMENFRGCMEDVYYNGVKVIEKARARSGAVRVEGVTWNCAPEFDADLGTEISFVDDGAYLVLPKINSRAGGRWQIEFKTISRNAVLLYNAGGGRSDYLSVEVLEGTVRVRMARGQVAHTTRVDDGHWHKMHLLFNPSLIELSIDNLSMSTRIESGGTRYLDLSDTFYLGGIESDKRQRAFAKGVKAADSSIMGCIKPIEVDDKIFGLPHAVVTSGVTPKCVWYYPCQTSTAASPCVPHAVCTQHGVDHFTCTCDLDLCINPDYAEKYKVFSKSSSLELVSLYPLTVSEGGVSVITTQHIDVVLDHHKYGVRPAGVVFAVDRPPKHGRLAIDLSPQRYTLIEDTVKAKQMFTLLDLAKDKVRYVHDGSENHQDAIVLDMELIQETKFTLPSYLQGRHTFVLHVNVTPVNDPPVLTLLPGKVLRLTQGTRKLITSDILKAEDPDTPPEDLLYTVLHGKNDANSGHIEMSGQPVDSFTQQDVDNGLISFVHTAIADKHLNKTSLRITLQVSDGIETSGPGVVRVSVAPLQVRLVNNTGVQLVHNSYALITQHNLTFATNLDSDLDTPPLRYDIVKPPQFGVVERMRVADGTWQTVDSFTSDMIQHGHVRYVHLLGTPTHDEFKFKASVGSVRTNTLYDFRLTFIKLELYEAALKEVVLNDTREAFITSDHLKFASRPLALPSDRIVYTVVRPPKYGVLRVKTGGGGGGGGARHLVPRTTFTQADLDEGHVWYRLHRRAYSHVHDEVVVGVAVAGAECAAAAATLALRHVPPAAPAPRPPPSRRLQLPEGGRAPLPAAHLDVRAGDVTDLVFNVTRLPRHGKLEVLDEHMRATRDNATYFTLRELQAERVYYAHDDSESGHDSFHYMALSPEPEDFQYVGVFHVDVALRNDNSPVRADRGGVFHVVHGGTRLVTARDLAYVDADLDTRPADLVYTVQRYTKEPPNGGLFRADNPTEQIARFTQEDIDKNLVLFKHRGKEEGRLSFWVSDGVFDVNGHLEVVASPPYVRARSEPAVVCVAGVAVLRADIDTNMNCLEEDVRYEVTLPPKHGTLELAGAPATTFTQLDVAAGRLVYRHGGATGGGADTGSGDQFGFKVTCLDAWGAGVYHLRVFPPSYWEPLRVAAHNILYVEESTTVNITRDVLEVMHPHIEPANIVYHIVESPRHGWVEVRPPAGGGVTPAEGEGARAHSFDQAAVNERRVLYVQAGVNRSRDSILLNATNGITSLSDLRLEVVIVPEHYYVSADNVTLLEGGRASLRPDMFHTLTDYYRGKVVAYKILDKPKYGKIVLDDQPIQLLSVLKLNSGDIQYVHDGSEETFDSFRVVGVTGSNKQSMPFDVGVFIEPVNDEPPIVAANTGLCVWAGGAFTLTRNELYVNDVDTPLENVTVSIVDIVSGYMARTADRNTPIRSFTQADIDAALVIFVHTNGSKGKMIFNVTDGLHELSKITFLISTKAVSLKIVRNQKLLVFPLMREPVTNSTLLAKCSDVSREIVYVVERAPALGRLVLAGLTATRFTQGDVDRGDLHYEHTHPFSDLKTEDSFVFTLEAALATPLAGNTYNVEVSVAAGGLARYVRLPRIVLLEGEEAPLPVEVGGVLEYLERQAGVRAPKLEVVAAAPKHGDLRPLAPATLDAASLAAGHLVYEHDHSDTTSDEVRLALYLLPDYVLLCNVTLPIEITPVNDQPFRLLTDTPQIQVVQGENYTLTRADLLTEDADTPPADIIYDIISGPTQGRVMVLPDPSPSPPDPAPPTPTDSRSVNRFSQADVDAGRVLYEHSGALQTATFYFRVWDGHFKPTYTVFTIDVLGVILKASGSRPLLLQQGSNVATLTAEQVYVETNADRDKVWYNVSGAPAHGQVYLGREVVASFSHRDLAARRVLYMQNDMTAANDSFELRASVHHAPPSAPFPVPVRVVPLVAVSEVRADAGRTRLTVRNLDATRLAELTAGDPLYSVLRAPRHGSLRKIIRASGANTTARDTPLAYFTHEDVKAGVVYYVLDKKIDEVNGLEDSFTFLLAASIFQPAAGDLKILIGNRHKKNLPGPNDPESHEGVPVGGTEWGYYVSVCMGGAGVCVAALCVLMGVRCRRHWARERALDKLPHIHPNAGLAPIPLPRPPDHLMPSPKQHTPTIKRSYAASEGGGVGVGVGSGTGASTPLASASAGSGIACKVTPLADAALADLTARYPYGVDDHTDAEDWSSYEASECAYGGRGGSGSAGGGGAGPIPTTGPAGPTGPAANPMLRRNQYWV